MFSNEKQLSTNINGDSRKADIKWMQLINNIMKNQKFFVESAADGTFSILRRNESSGKLETHMVNLTKEQADLLAHNMNLIFSEEEAEFEEQDEKA